MLVGPPSIFDDGGTGGGVNPSGEYPCGMMYLSEGMGPSGGIGIPGGGIV